MQPALIRLYGTSSKMSERTRYQPKDGCVDKPDANSRYQYEGSVASERFAHFGIPLHRMHFLPIGVL